MYKRHLIHSLIALASLSLIYRGDVSAQDSQDSSTEAPPAPEAPYPNAPDPDQAPPVAPKTAAPAARRAAPASRAYPREAPPPIAADVRRPEAITKDDQYHYGTELEEPTFSGPREIVAPAKANKAGEFFYPQDKEDPKFSGRAGVEKPTKILKSGEFQYKTQGSPERASASFRMGAVTPPKITGANGVRYTDIYGAASIPVLYGDYEWRLVSSLGRFGIKFGSGLMASSGNGRFKNSDPAATRVTEVAEEKFTFITFPNQVTASYKFQYLRNQLFVPFVEGGAGYYTFAEIRDDDKGPKFGGAAVSVAAGGVNFLMDWLDPKAIRQLDNDYGINHVWLTVEFRLIVGLNPKYDYSSNGLSAGFVMDF